MGMEGATTELPETTNPVTVDVAVTTPLPCVYLVGAPEPVEMIVPVPAVGSRLRIDPEVLETSPTVDVSGPTFVKAPLTALDAPTAPPADVSLTGSPETSLVITTDPAIGSVAVTAPDTAE
jgi:hypothetical protein